MYFKSFMTFNNWWNANSTQRFLPFRSIGGEYKKLTPFFQRVGIVHHVSCPHTHQQNGSTKRKHHHIIEVSLSLLAHASTPLKFWDEAFSTAG
jgi:hypothetical protein